MNWRVITFDNAITRARERGFNDPDFAGWGDLDPQTRISCINQILHHNGAAHILFRKAFAKALWGFRETESMNQAFERVSRQGWDDHLKAMVVADIHPVDQDTWLAYLRQKRELWDYESKDRIEL